MWLSRFLLLAAGAVLLYPHLRYLCVYLMAGFALVTVSALVQGHVSCECGGPLMSRRSGHWVLDREGEPARVCACCAVEVCCPHGVLSQHTGPCGTCSVPARQPGR
jgi:hypothetical protein